MQRQDRQGAELRVQGQLVKLRAADAALADVVGHLLKWEKPGATAVVLMGTALQNTHLSWPAEVTAIVNALQGYQSYLDFEEGKAAPLRRVVMTERPDDWHAALAGTGGRQWAAGRSANEALADLVRSHADVMGVEIDWPGETAAPVTPPNLSDDTLDTVPPHLARVYTAPRAELVATVVRVVEVMFPDGDPDHEGGADEVGEVANVLVEAGFAPDSESGEESGA